MSGFRADLDALTGLIAQMSGFGQRAEALASELDASVRRLHGEWSGTAAAEHLAAHHDWVAGAQRMQSALDELRSLVHTAHTNYAAAAVANARMWG